MRVHDWRGNAYENGEPLWLRDREAPNGVQPVMCCWPMCEAQAVRNVCNAEGSPARTHHHGGIHRLSDGTLSDYCAEHGSWVRTDNRGYFATGKALRRANDALRAAQEDG